MLESWQSSPWISFELQSRSCSFQLSRSQVVSLQSSSLQQLADDPKAKQSTHHWLLGELQLEYWFHQTFLKTRLPLSQLPCKILGTQIHSTHLDDTNGCSDPDDQPSQSPCHHHLHHLSNQEVPAAGATSTSAGTLSCRGAVGNAGKSSRTPTWGSLGFDPEKVVQDLGHSVLVQSTMAKQRSHHTAPLLGPGSLPFDHES